MASVSIKIKFLILNLLLEPERKYWTKFVDEMITLNERESAKKTHTFLYQGQLFMHSGIGKAYPTIGNPALQMQFVDRFQREHSQFKVVNNEVQQIWQALLPLSGADTLEIRNGFPDELVQYIPDLSMFNRTKDQKYYLDNLSTAHRLQYETLLPRLHYYLALRMIT